MDPNMNRNNNISILQAIQSSQQYSSAPQTPLTGEQNKNLMFSSSPRSLEEHAHEDFRQSKVSAILRQPGFHSPTPSDFNKQLNFPSPNLSWTPPGPPQLLSSGFLQWELPRLDSMPFLQLRSLRICKRTFLLFVIYFSVKWKLLQVLSSVSNRRVLEDRSGLDCQTDRMSPNLSIWFDIV